MAYIDREKFAEAICNFPAIDEDAANAVISLLHRQTTANGLIREYVKPDDFCSYGERRTDDEV